MDVGMDVGMDVAMEAWLWDACLPKDAWLEAQNHHIGISCCLRVT